MDERLNAAIEALLSKLEEQTRSVLETKNMINSLRQMIGEEPLFSGPELQASNGEVTAIKADQYYGKPLAASVRDYLERRKTACPAEEILKGLEQGAFDFYATGWKERDRLRSLSISLAKNTAIFHRLPNGTFGLLAWYPEVANRRSEAQKNQESGKEEPSGEEQA